MIKLPLKLLTIALFILSTHVFGLSELTRLTLKDLPPQDIVISKQALESLEVAEVLLTPEQFKITEAALLQDEKQHPDTYLTYYMNAYLLFLKGIYFQDYAHNNQAAKDAFEKSLNALQNSLDRRSAFSDAHRLSGDIYGLLIDLKFAPIYGSLYSSKAKKHFKKAQDANPENPEVYLAQGRMYFYTPVAFGGSKKKALQYFERAQEICPKSYTPYTWIGIAKAAKNQNDEARNAFKKALDLEPRSFFAQSELKKLN